MSTTDNPTIESPSRSGTGTEMERGLSGRSVGGHVSTPSPTSGAPEPPQRTNRQPVGTVNLRSSPCFARSGSSGDGGSASYEPVVEQHAECEHCLARGTTVCSGAAPVSGPANQPCQLGDAIIAGVAWFNDAIVVTRNPADFEVQGVRVLGYE